MKLQITSGKTSAAMMLALGLSVSASFPGTASAVTLMDLLRGGPGKVERDRGDRGLPGVFPQGAQTSVANDADPEPLPKVTGPKYYTYKADATRAVSTDNFVESLKGVKLKATPDVAKALEAYYGTGTQPIWVTNGELNARASAVLAFFETVGESGLDPADYSISAPSPDVTASISEQPQPIAQDVAATESQVYKPAIMQFELALSAKVLTYVQDTCWAYHEIVDPRRGRRNPSPPSIALILHRPEWRHRLRRFEHLAGQRRCRA